MYYGITIIHGITKRKFNSSLYPSVVHLCAQLAWSTFIRYSSKPGEILVRGRRLEKVPVDLACGSPLSALTTAASL